MSPILFYHRDLNKTKKKGLSQLIRSFYIRRFLRIFPIYYLLIIGLFLVNYQNTREIMPWLITYTSNIQQSIYGNDLGNFNHFWSLAVEEQFYIFWPFLILFATPKRSLEIILAVILLSLASRTYLFANDYNWMAISYFTLSNMQALGIGALLAYIFQYKNSLVNQLSKSIWVYSGILIYVGGFLVKMIYKLDWYGEIFDTFVFSCTVSLIILRASTKGFTGGMKYLLENRIVTYAGKISYGLYIFHLFIPGLIYWLIPATAGYNGAHAYSKYLLFIFYYLITFLFAHLSWKLIESPLNNLKQKFPYQ
ncbi:MAG TPA: acyltransferase [Bacteroidetes bacterium]|nr:acyltransferase [Bacteroidota bacterium]